MNEFSSIEKFGLSEEQKNVLKQLEKDFTDFVVGLRKDTIIEKKFLTTDNKQKVIFYCKFDPLCRLGIYRKDNILKLECSVHKLKFPLSEGSRIKYANKPNEECKTKLKPVEGNERCLMADTGLQFEVLFVDSDPDPIINLLICLNEACKELPFI